MEAIRGKVNGILHRDDARFHNRHETKAEEELIKARH
jgi:hypothetical protein